MATNRTEISKLVYHCRHLIFCVTQVPPLIRTVSFSPLTKLKHRINGTRFLISRCFFTGSKLTTTFQMEVLLVSCVYQKENFFQTIRAIRITYTLVTTTNKIFQSYHYLKYINM